MRKVVFKNEEDESNPQLKILQSFIEFCINAPYKPGHVHPLKRALNDFNVSGKASVNGKVFDQKETLGNIKSFSPSDYFDIVTK